MPGTTVGAIIYPDNERRDKILLTRRNIEPYKERWCLPGGHIDENEPAEQAIVREVREETGLEFSPNFFRFYDEIIPEYDTHHVVLIFNGVGSGEIDRQEAEVQEIEWFPVRQTVALPLAFQHNRILEDYQQYML
ncbi:MAG TPA: NUDIX hydrolase [bacterium]|nr:NUDIX hydrolase [bacterium]